MCAVERWSVVCGCVLQRGQRGEGWCVSSTLCRYDIRMGLSLVLNWARVRRVSPGRESSEGETPGGALVYQFVMAALHEVCLYYAGVVFVLSLPRSAAV